MSTASDGFRAPHEARDALRGWLASVVRCLTTAHLLIEPVSGTEGVFGFGARRYVHLRGRDALWLRVAHSYRLYQDEAGWVARTVSYSYEVRLGDRQEIIAYHWHPGSGRPDGAPHAHFRTLREPVALEKAHFPTGGITFAAIARLLIEDCGAEPLEPGWAAALQRADAALAAAFPPVTSLPGC